MFWGIQKAYKMKNLRFIEVNGYCHASTVSPCICEISIIHQFEIFKGIFVKMEVQRWRYTEEILGLHK